jgi:hypothetical protein
MGKKTRFILLTSLLVSCLLSGGALIYSLVTYSNTSTGHVVITAPEGITVPTSVEFGSITQGGSSSPVAVTVQSTVNQATSLTVSSGGDVSVAMTEGASVTVPAFGSVTVHLTVTDDGAALGSQSFTITFTAAEG